MGKVNREHDILLAGPVSSVPVPPEIYLDSAIASMSANPVSGFETAATAELARPFVDLLASHGLPARESILRSLSDSYWTATGANSAHTAGAGRVLVSQILHTAQQRAFDSGDAQFSAQLVQPICAPIIQELMRGTFSAIPPLLTESLHAALDSGSRGRPRRAARDGAGLRSPGWHFEQDQTTIHSTLAGLALYGIMDVSRGASVDFLLTHWGLNPATLRSAWRRGFRNDSNVIAYSPGAVIAVNLFRIAAIERLRSGISSRLNRLDGGNINCFARLPLQFLLHQDKLPPENSKVTAVFSTLSDTTNALARPRFWNSLLSGAKRRGDFVRYYEYGSKPERRAVEGSFVSTYPAGRRRSILELGHSDGFGLQMFVGPDEDTSMYGVHDMLADPDRARRLYEGVGAVAVFGCKSHLKGGLTDVIKQFVPVGVGVEGLPANMGPHTHVRYRGNGVGLSDSTWTRPLWAVRNYGLRELLRHPPAIRTRRNPEMDFQTAFRRAGFMQDAGGL